MTNEKAILNTVCDLDGCAAMIDSIIGATLGDSYEFEKEQTISALMLLKRNIDNATNQIRNL